MYTGYIFYIPGIFIFFFSRCVNVFKYLADPKHWLKVLIFLYINFFILISVVGRWSTWRITRRWPALSRTSSSMSTTSSSGAFSTIGCWLGGWRRVFFIHTLRNSVVEPVQSWPAPATVPAPGSGEQNLFNTSLSKKGSFENQSK